MKVTNTAPVIAVLLMLIAANTAPALPEQLNSFLDEAPSSVFARVAVGTTDVALLAHEDSLERSHVVSGIVYILAFGSDHGLFAWHRSELHSDFAAGYASDTEFVFHMTNPDTARSELVYLNTAQDDFRVYTVRAHFIGGIVIWDGVVFYATEHFDDNLHYLDLDTGEVHIIEGTGNTVANTDFWVVDGELIGTNGGDYGIPYRISREGITRAPDVTVTADTKVGFNLRTIRIGEDLSRYEALLGIE